ncbi:unnamed protein product, partial [Rotaria magnacalcarata]
IYCSALAQLDQFEDFLVKQKQFQTKPYAKRFQTNHAKIGRATSPTAELVEQLLQQQVNELLQQQNWSTNFSNERSINFSNNKCSRATVQEKYDKNFK